LTDEWLVDVKTDYAGKCVLIALALTVLEIEDHFLVPALRKSYGNKFQRAGEQQKTLTSGFLSATTDGILVGMPDDCLAHLGIPDIGGDRSLVIEFKSIDPRVELTAPKPAHGYQCQVQLGLVHELTRRTGLNTV